MTAPGPDAARSDAALFDAALFDMDGLLVDSEPLWRRAETEVFGRHGLALTEDQCRETQGRVIGEVTQMWFERHPWTGPGPDDVALEVLDAVDGLLASSAVAMPGALAAVEACRVRGMRLGLASSSPRWLIDTVVGRLGLEGRFEVLHSAEDEAAGKPDPAVFLSAARLLGVAARRCVVFEDAPAGVEAAKAAGMTCVAVPEQPVADLSGFARADAVLGSLEEVGEGLWERLRLGVAVADDAAGAGRGPFSGGIA